MKKLFYTFFITILMQILILPSMCFAKVIDGGVSYNVNSAREYVQEGIPDNFTFSGHAFFKDGSDVQKALYTYGNDGSIIGITVLYKDSNDVAYIYGRDFNLKFVDKYDRNVNIYPHRGYRYDLNGNLILTSLTVSKDELFRFSPDGKLIVHSIKGIIYDENGNILGRAK